MPSAPLHAIACFDAGGRLVFHEPELARLLGIAPGAALPEVAGRLEELGIGPEGGSGGGLRWRRIPLPGPEGGVLLLVGRERHLPEGDVLGWFSHVIRTPLTGLLGYIENLSDRVYGPLPPQAEGALRDLRLQGLRLRHAVEDLLSLVEEESGRGGG